MLVAVSGSQGSGKSTVLKAIEDMGFTVIRRKTSRSILEEWGVTLSEINNDHNRYIEFQEEIARRKHNDEMDVLEQCSDSDNQLIFTERTFADVFCYTIFAVGKDNEFSEWINKYYLTCLKYQQHYDAVFCLRGGLFPIENDGVRGVNRYYSDMMDLCLQDYTRRMTHPCKYSLVDTPIHEERVTAIVSQSMMLPF